MPPHPLVRARYRRLESRPPSARASVTPELGARGGCGPPGRISADGSRPMGSRAARLRSVWEPGNLAVEKSAIPVKSVAIHGAHAFESARRDECFALPAPLQRRKRCVPWKHDHTSASCPAHAQSIGGSRCDRAGTNRSKKRALPVRRSSCSRLQGSSAGHLHRRSEHAGVDE
jgi:hypothetical protein